MTTLYKPVEITSAEQAEALAVGTIAVFPGEPSAAVRVDYGLGWHIAGDEMSNDHSYMTGWVALVPIEAEEETYTVKTSDGKWHFGNGNWTRLVTPWEEA